ncbi:hypothetical protein VTN96DRAFT_5016 [Rasamsonia emersonii]
MIRIFTRRPVSESIMKRRLHETKRRMRSSAVRISIQNFSWFQVSGTRISRRTVRRTFIRFFLTKRTTIRMQRTRSTTGWPRSRTMLKRGMRCGSFFQPSFSTDTVHLGCVNAMESRSLFTRGLMVEETAACYLHYLLKFSDYSTSGRSWSHWLDLTDCAFLERLQDLVFFF